MPDKPIGKLIKDLRDAPSRRWSQSELGRRAGVKASTISRIESGDREDPGFATVAKISKAFGFSPGRLTEMTWIGGMEQVQTPPDTMLREALDRLRYLTPDFIAKGDDQIVREGARASVTRSD